MRPDLRELTSIHIIGIGGAGMAAIAEVLHGMGHDVSGSDLNDSDAFRRLVELGVRVAVGHSSENVTAVDGTFPSVVARSTAIPDSNPEVIATNEHGQPVLRRAELLGAITSLTSAVAVAGTHGKTTTSSMLTVMALKAGIEPSYIIGGRVNELGTGAAWGAGDWFIVEADESDGTFLELGHTIGIVTNVEPDHLEHYGGERQLRAAFAHFVSESRVAVVCADDPGASLLAHQSAHHSNVVTYGQDADASYRMGDLVRAAEGTSFELIRSGTSLGRLTVPMPGLHNAQNAAGAAAAAMEMGLPFAAIRDGLAEFGGVGRRFDRRGCAAGVDFVDDYAHLPTEVASAIDAATDLGAARVVVVFQPHRYSRTEALWRDFADAFDKADLLIVTGIYSSGEAPRDGVSGRLIVDAVETGSNHPEIVYHEARETLASFVAPLLRAGDVCLTLGAGDSVTLPDELIAILDDRQDP